MKRLLGQIGITYLSVLAVVFYIGGKAAWILAAVFLFALVVTLCVKGLRTTIYLPVMAAVALVACVVNITYTSCVYYPTVVSYHNYSGTVSATLKEEPYEYYGTYCYEFKTDAIGEEPCNLKFALFYDELLDIEAFDKVEMVVCLSDNANAKLMSKRCFLVADFEHDTPQYSVSEPQHKPLYYYAIRLRQYIRKVLCSTLSDDTAALCRAVLIGDRYALSDSTRQNFVKAGASHLIVVSGMHFSILAGIICFFAQIFRRYKRYLNILLVIFIIAYMALTGFSPSVIRSGIMLLIYSFGLIISREAYGLNSLGVASLAVTMFNPYSVGDVGLLMSFATTLSILSLGPKLHLKFYKRIYKRETDSKIRLLCLKAIMFIVDMLCVNVAAFVASIPLSILFFSSVSTMSVISSFVLYFPIWLILVLSLVFSIVYYIPVVNLIAPIFIGLLEFISQLIFSVVSYFAQLPFSYINIEYRYVYLWLVFGLLVFVLMCLTKSRSRTKVMALCSVFILLMGYVSAVYINHNTPVLNVYDVDNGTAVTYSSGETHAVLSLYCNKSNVISTINKMKKHTSELDFYSSVSDTKNSMNSLVSCGKEFAISSVLLYDTKRDKSLPNTLVDVVTPHDVHTVYLEDALITYYLVDDAYITYLDSAKGSVLILPQLIDAKDIPKNFRTADTIVMNNCPLNFEVLSCDTLIISAEADYARYVMNFAYSISDRVLLTAHGDIRFVMGV